MTIRLSLDYYDNDHKKKLTFDQPYASARTASKVSAFQANSAISKADFYSYLLIHRQALVGYRSYAELLGKMSVAVNWIQDVVTTAAETLHLTRPGYRDKDLAEKVGESVGLCVISRLHRMTDADWTRLDTLPGVNGVKTFDFEIGSDGIRIIQVETKGSFLNDCRKKPTVVSNHANSIAGKKAAWETHPNFPQPSSIRYGTIAGIDAEHDARCWLLDPPAEDVSTDPFDLRVAKRLGFVANSIATIAPTASLPRIIGERINQILSFGARSFDGVALRTRGGRQFSPDSYVENFLARDKIFIEDLDIVGKLVQGGSEAPIFVGMKGDLARNAVRQNVNEIAATIFEQAELGVREIDSEHQQIGSVRRKIPINFQVSSGGFILGFPVE
ncbi:hypothetical protein QFZ99_001991 [Paraburkholderia atlantica]|uniref:hypothetical protein n=1 Tax=Paraburkholderia atlantica TaxID=2654982 RepID=UPI003D24EC14